MPINEDLKAQLKLWYDVLLLCNGCMSIPNPDPFLAPWAIDCWTDAAGGTLLNPWHGVGSVTSFWWAYAPWGRKINSGQDAGRGRSLNRVMSALELLGPLLTLASGFSWC